MDNVGSHHKLRHAEQPIGFFNIYFASLLIPNSLLLTDGSAVDGTVQSKKVQLQEKKVKFQVES